MGNELSHSNTDPDFLGGLSRVYNDACKNGMACSLRTGGAPSMYDTGPEADMDDPAPAAKGPGLNLS